MHDVKEQTILSVHFPLPFPPDTVLYCDGSSIPIQSPSLVRCSHDCSRFPSQERTFVGKPRSIVCLEPSCDLGDCSVIEISLLQCQKEERTRESTRTKWGKVIGKGMVPTGKSKLVMSLSRDGSGVEPALSNHGFFDYCLNRQLPEIVPWGKGKGGIVPC